MTDTIQLESGLGDYLLEDSSGGYRQDTQYLMSIKLLDDRKSSWNETVKNSPSLYEYLKKEVYNEL